MTTIPLAKMAATLVTNNTKAARDGRRVAVARTVQVLDLDAERVAVQLVGMLEVVFGV